MPVFLYDHASRSVFVGTISSDAGKHQHPFGGTAAQQGIAFDDPDPPLHFLFGLSVDDPIVRSIVPQCAEPLVPVIFGFSYPSEYGFVYRNVNSTIEIRSPRTLRYDPTWFGEQFPGVFPSRFINLEPTQPDLNDPIAALDFASIFGIDLLTETQLETAIRWVRDETDLFQVWNMPDWSDKDLVEFAHPGPFWQWKPETTCKAGLSCGRNTLRVIGIVTDDEIACDGQIILQHCLVCGCLATTHQCT